MYDVKPDDAPALDWVEGAIYAFFERSQIRLRRFIVVDNEFNEFIFKDVSTKWDRTQRNAIAIPGERLKKLVKATKLIPERDYVRPDFMAEDDQGLKLRSPKTVKARGDKALTDEERAARVDDWLAKRDRDFTAIAPLVGDAASLDRKQLLLLAYSPRRCSHRVATFAREHRIELTALKRLLHKYAWFGLDRNALLQLDSFRGKSGLLTRRNVEKPGPDDAAVRVYGEKYQNRPRAKRDLTIIAEALLQYWVKWHMTLQDTYEAMKKAYYRRSNQYGSSPIQESLIPTFRMFEYAARILVERLGLRALREGHKDGRELKERRGRDSDISPNVAEVFDIDGTPFNRELVCRFKVEGRRVNIGKPYVVLVYARTSRKCVGWHVYLGNENWKEGYRLALFCALTSKRERLKWLNIDAPQAWPDDENIRPSFVYVDGGPGASKTGRAALARLRIGFHKAPPDTPYWKPTVESGLGREQRKQAHLDGGYERTNSSVEKDARRIAKLHARSTLWAFEHQLVLNIIKYNDSVQKGMRLPAQLKEEVGPARTPNSYHSTGIARLGGIEHRRVTDAEVYQHLLTRADVFAGLDGFQLIKSTYQSEGLRAHVQSNGKGRITVLYDPLRMRAVYWRTPDGALEELFQDESSKSENGLASAHDLTTYEEAIRASEIKSGRQGKKGNRDNLTQRQKGIALSTVEEGRKPVRKSGSKSQESARDYEGAVDLQTRTYDRPENFIGPSAAQAASSEGKGAEGVKAVTPSAEVKAAEGLKSLNKSLSIRTARLAAFNLKTAVEPTRPALEAGSARPFGR